MTFNRAAKTAPVVYRMRGEGEDPVSLKDLLSGTHRGGLGMPPRIAGTPRGRPAAQEAKGGSPRGASAEQDPAAIRDEVSKCLGHLNDLLSRAEPIMGAPAGAGAAQASARGGAGGGRSSSRSRTWACSGEDEAEVAGRSRPPGAAIRSRSAQAVADGRSVAMARGTRPVVDMSGPATNAEAAAQAVADILAGNGNRARLGPPLTPMPQTPRAPSCDGAGGGSLRASSLGPGSGCGVRSGSCRVRGGAVRSVYRPPTVPVRPPNMFGRTSAGQRRLSQRRKTVGDSVEGDAFDGARGAASGAMLPPRPPAGPGGYSIGPSRGVWGA
mmetsp:Transcript_79586/g.170656  ORF Transcript_79586/g.170656 Transcript_79586/m.170656 type:complete len:326 (+) Transcript_79586:72-1049(+)